MKKQYQYTLFILLFIIVYEMYLIAIYKYRDFEINNYMYQIQNENDGLKKSIEEKKIYLQFIKTPAYQDYIGKSTQNRKHNFEEVLLLVSQDEKNLYSLMDTEKQLAAIPKKESRPTDNMSNTEKWIYYIFHKNIQLQ